jgi:hypothetical protein
MLAYSLFIDKKFRYDIIILKRRRIKMILKIVLTILVLLSLSYLNYFIDVVDPIIANKVAIQQFKSSDTAYIVSQYGIHLTQFIKTLLSIGFLLIIGFLWWKPIKKIIATLVILLFVLMPAVSSYAYYEKQNWPEPVFILPNESAFFIPDIGDNKESQAKLNTEEYLRDNKIPTKRFLIPHKKLEGSGWAGDYYVPTGRMIIIDRTPYHREWASDSQRGTSKTDQSFPCQTKEGLNVTAEITIAVSVTEDDSPKFLYKFGVKPPTGDRNKPEIIFTSVYFGRSLTEVMDGVGRGMVQSLVAEELSSRSMEQANSQMPEMMQNIRTKVGAFLKTSGITLDYIGWAGTLSFDKDIQKAINDAYSAKKIEPYMPVIQKMAMLNAVNKWDGKVPATLFLFPGKVVDALTEFFESKSKIGAGK